MFSIWLLIPVIIMLMLLIYMFFAFRQMLSLFTESKKVKNIISVIVTAVFILPAFNLFGSTRLWSLIVLHLFVFRLITQLINFIVKRLNNNIWNYIYRLMIIPILCTVLLFAYGYYNIKDVKRTEYNVTTDKNITQNYKAVLEADIHFGNATNEYDIQKITNRVSDENADIVMLCGDIVDESTTKAQMQNLFKILGDTKNKYGIYYVYGNHDKAQYSQSPNFTEQELTEAIEGSGITILEDSSVEINNDLILIGRKDRSTYRMNIDEITNNLDKEKYIIAMDHQPNEFKEKAESGVDLQISGHTHGGQIFPISLINKLINFADLNYGKETFKNMEAVVTSGISGWGYPIRTDGHSEYVIINISGFAK